MQLKPVWIASTGDEAIYAFNPLVIGDTLYALAEKDHILALDAATGKQKWSHSFHAKTQLLTNRGLTYWQSKDSSDARLIFAADNALQEIDARTGRSIDAFGKDGHIDLWGSWPDVFASVANYFREYGWESGGPVIAETRLAPDPTFQIDPKNLELNATLASLNATGVQVDTPLPPATPAVLISAELQDGPSYRVGFRNFHVITRYNHSARYAMAVHDLAQAVAARVHAPVSGS